MLQAIRDRVTGVVAFVILGLLAVPFLFFGLEQYVRGIPQDAIATVGDSDITLTEFQTEFAMYRAQLRAQQGENYNELATNQPQFRREFLDNMIDQRLLTEHARAMGLSVSPNSLLEVIRSIPAFQVDGEFDASLYQQRLQANGQSPRQFEQELAADLLLRELPSAVSASAFVTEQEIERWLQVQLQSREVALVPIDSAPFRDADTITDERIETFYNENTEQFMRPEEISVEYVVLDTRDMLNSIEIEENELRQRYESVQSRYMTQEQRRASHILLVENDERSADETRELANTLRGRIEQGEDFAELAVELSDDPGSSGQGGDLGLIESDIMPEAFEQTLFAMQPDEISDPVETEFGWHIIRLDEVIAPRGQTFDEARDEIATLMREEQADDLYVDMLERMIDLIYADPTGLESVAGDLDLELQTAGPFSRFTAEGLMADPRVLEEAFSDLVLVERQTSEPIELERNQAVVVRVTEHQPSAPRLLADVSDEIRDRLAREEAREAARAYGEELITQAGQDGQQLAEVAAAEELEFSERTITRRDFDLGSQVLNGIFALPDSGDTVEMHLVERGGGWTLVRLDDVVAGNPTDADDAQRQSASLQISMTRTNQEVQGLLEWLRANTEINVVEDRLM
ncbi:MAG: SurA N-terminal domain-containing protein [Pseudomonadota bacterium]